MTKPIFKETYSTTKISVNAQIITAYLLPVNQSIPLVREVKGYDLRIKPYFLNHNGKDELIIGMNRNAFDLRADVVQIDTLLTQEDTMLNFCINKTDLKFLPINQQEGLAHVLAIVELQPVSE